MDRGEPTILTKATSKSDSLRTTVPSSIVKQFGLKEGDKIIWQLGVIGGELGVTVKLNKK